MKNSNYIAIAAIVLSFIFSGYLKAAASDSVYPSQWDIKVLDFTLTPAEDDGLNALTIKNTGFAPNTYFAEVVLYKDDGDGIFEGWKADQEVGKGAYYDSSQVFYWKDLSVAVPKTGQRFFVAVETKKNEDILVDARTIQMIIPILYDADSDGVFDLATDTGIFMNSKSNGPQSEILSLTSQTIYKRSFDTLVPETVITYPLDGAKIAEKNIIILGASRDQGGSTPSSVKINITKLGAENANWSDVIATDSNYSAWKFDWNNIEDGVYTIKTKAADWIGNIGEETGITITVDTTPAPSVSPVPTPAPTPAPSASPAPKPQNVSDGDLVRAAGDYKVYVVKGYYRRWIQSAEIFAFYGHLSFAIVKEITKQDLETYKESSLVRAEGDEKVYEAGADGLKRWLNMTGEQFSASGRKWDAVYIINGKEKDYYKTGADIVQ